MYWYGSVAVRIFSAFPYYSTDDEWTMMQSIVYVDTKTGTGQSQCKYSDLVIPDEEAGEKSESYLMHMSSWVTRGDLGR